MNIYDVAKKCNIDWLLDCEPRPAQIEALARSYNGHIWRNHKDEDIVSPVHLNHAGRPSAGYAFFMEMRVGKTPTALNEHKLFNRDYGVNKVFMFSPNKYKHDWAAEAERFGIDVPIHVFETKRRGDFAKFMGQVRGEGGFVVANYEALTQPANVSLFSEWIDDKTYMGADESAHIKNNNANMSKKAILLAKSAAVTRPMSGLPNPQGPADFWAQLRFARQISGFNYYAFKAKFSKMGGFKNKKVIGTRNEEELHKILEGGSFVAKRRDWGTKIDSDYEEIKLDMLPEQQIAYDEMDEEFVTWLNSEEFVSAEQVITKRIKLQQIASGFIIDEMKNVRELVPFDKTPKFIDVIDRLENYISGKVIIIAHYTATLKKLYSSLQKYNPALIMGNQHMNSLGLFALTEKNRFNLNENCRVILGQGQAIKYGHTLMGNKDDPCLSMIFYENSYNLDTRTQCEERPQGEGQQAAIHMMDYYSSPVEREIVRALQFKKSVSAAMLDFYGREK